MRHASSLAAILCLLPSAALAAAPDAGVEVGYSRLVSGNGMNGFGVNLYGGWSTDVGLMAELKAGLRYYTEERRLLDATTDRTLWIFPVVAGARYVLPIDAAVRPFLALHAGLGVVRAEAEITNAAIRSADSETSLGFALHGGVGAHWFISRHVLLGAALWYEVTFADGIDSSEVQDLLVGLDLRFLI